MPATADPLDSVFQVLASPTRRAVVERLGRGPARVGELAEPFDMALPSFMQHLRMLENSGVVRSEKRGRSRIVSLVPNRLAVVGDWLGKQETLWKKRLDRLEDYLKTMDD